MASTVTDDLSASAESKSDALDNTEEKSWKVPTATAVTSSMVEPAVMAGLDSRAAESTVWVGTEVGVRTAAAASATVLLLPLVPELRRRRCSDERDESDALLHKWHKQVVNESLVFSTTQRGGVEDSSLKSDSTQEVARFQ